MDKIKSLRDYLETDEEKTKFDELVKEAKEYNRLVELGLIEPTPDYED